MIQFPAKETKPKSKQNDEQFEQKNEENEAATSSKLMLITEPTKPTK